MDITAHLHGYYDLHQGPKTELPRHPIVILHDLARTRSPDITHSVKTANTIFDILRSPPPNTPLHSYRSQIDIAVVSYGTRAHVDFDWVPLDRFSLRLAATPVTYTSDFGQGLAELYDRFAVYLHLMCHHNIPVCRPHYIHITGGNALIDANSPPYLFYKEQALSPDYFTMLHFLAHDPPPTQRPTDDPMLATKQALTALSGPHTVFDARHAERLPSLLNFKINFEIYRPPETTSQ